jgi:hypothetical protein
VCSQGLHQRQVSTAGAELSVRDLQRTTIEGVLIICAGLVCNLEPRPTLVRILEQIDE